MMGIVYIAAHQSHTSLGIGIIRDRNNLDSNGQPQLLNKLILTALDWIIVHS